MMARAFIRPDGTTQFLYDETLVKVLDEDREGDVRRISRIDTYHDLTPEAKNMVAEEAGFFVDWTISGRDRVDGPFDTRSAALAFEKVMAEAYLSKEPGRLDVG